MISNPTTRAANSPVTPGASTTPVSISPDGTGWWDARVYTDGSLGKPDVALAPDLTAGDGDAVQAVSANQPHSNPASPVTIDFDYSIPRDMTAVRTTAPFVPSGGSFTVYCLSSWTDYTDNNQVMIACNGSHFRLSTGNGSTVFFRIANGANVGVISVGHTDNDLHLWVMRYDADTDVFSIERDAEGVLNSDSFTFGVGEIDTVYLGNSSGGGGLGSTGSMAAAFIVPRAVTGAEHTAMVAHMMGRGGI